MRTAVRRGCLTIVLLVLLAAAPAIADERAVTPDGAIHTIEEIAWGQGPTGDGGTMGGSALRHTLQHPDGDRESHLIPGTDDFTLDRDPSLDLDPGSGDVVVVWSRIEKRGQHQVRVARFDGSAWSEPRTLYDGGTPDARPEVRIARSHVHVVWEQDAEGLTPRRLRIDLDRETLDPVYGPEDLPIPDRQDSVDGAGLPGPGDGLAYFGSLVPPEVGADHATIVVWGIRDEPVPITYMRSIPAPPGVLSTPRVVAEWIEDHLVVWFVSGARFFHGRRLDPEGVWTELQRIDLDDDLTAAEARLMVESMLRREAIDAPQD